MSSVCPTQDDLAAYALGKLPRERCEEIEMHVDECATCQAELETCGNAEDTFLSRLREPDSSAEFLVEVECADLLDRVAAIGSDPSFATQHQFNVKPAAIPHLGNIGPYRLLSKLGEGGMGTVFKAFHTKLKRVVALKLLPTTRMQDAQAIARFEREMEAVGNLVHANFVLAYDAGEHDGKHFLVMEYVEGIDLSEVVQSHGPLAIPDACEIVRQAAVGLQHAHEHGLVHRDIKPSNLMLTRAGTVKILDFGLALLPETGEAGRELTGTGQAMGTLDYMAPEQGGDSHDVDIRADIYSLGATLYKLLTGHAVFSGPQYQTHVQKWKALALQDAPTIQSRGVAIPDELAAVVHHMLARNAADRFATPAEVAGEIAPFCDGANLPALATRRTPAKVEEVPPSTTSLLKEAASFDTSSRHPGMAEVAPTQPIIVSAKATRRQHVRRRAFIAISLISIVGLLAALIIYFKTPYGMLRVEIDDPDISVQVKGEKIILTNADKKPIQLEIGKHALIVTRGDFTFETKQLTLKKGETINVKVELLPGAIRVVSDEDVIGLRAVAGSGETVEHFGLSFDGIDDFVDVSSLTYNGNTPITIEFYVNVADYPQAAQCVAGWYQMHLTADKESKYHVGWFDRNRRPHFLRSGSDVQLKRVHLAGVFEGDRFDLFVNGKLEARERIANKATQRPVETNLPMQVGALLTALDVRSQFFRGLIDQIRISSVARYTQDFTPSSHFDELDEDTIALYRCDEGSGDVLHDSSGNGHDGKIVGAKWVRVDDASHEEPAKLTSDLTDQYCLRFADAGDRVDTSEVLIKTNEPWTVEGWVTPRDPLPGGGEAALVFMIDPCWLSLRNGPPGIRWAVGGPTSRPAPTIYASEKIVTKQRSHVAMTHGPKGVSFYVNGILQGEPLPIVFFSRESRLRLRLPANPPRHDVDFQGDMDEVRVSSVERYRENFEPRRRFEPDDDTLALYHFDEGQGDVLHDSSGNNHHGKIVGAKWVEVKSHDENTQADDGNKVVDLLPLIDPQRDAVKGAWSRTDAGLKSDGTVPYCRLVIPYQPPAEYDFRIEFTAKGGNDILQLLNAGERSFSLLMGGWGGKFDGLDVVRNHPFLRDGQGIIGGPSSIKRGQRHTTTVQVRKDLVRAVIDGKTIVEHRTDGTDLSLPAEWTIPTGRLGLGTTFDETVFHRIDVVEVSGRGKVLP